jgi:rare lipoprotein A
MAESGGASWYGRKYHGRPTASGEPYDMFAMTAAHRTMPIPSYARVRNPANGAEVVVRINDRGPFAEGRVIDLSYTAALKLGVLAGVAPVELRRITQAEIRAGAAVPAPQPADPVPADRPAAALPPGGGLWLQLGAFRQREGAQALQQQVQREQPDAAVQVQEEGGLFRVRIGPFGNRADAAQAAARLRAQGLQTPLVVTR